MKYIVLHAFVSHDLDPLYLCDLLMAYSPSRALSSSNSNLLVVPRTRLSTLGGRPFSAMAPKLRNTLPQRPRDSIKNPIFYTVFLH